MCPAATLSASIDVLIVEDDPIIRLAVRQLLEGEGFTCAEMEDGRDLLDFALLCHPRLVLLDLMMPEVDGFTAAEQLRSHPGTQDILIHCLTALDFPAARRAAERSGCDVFLTKPFDVEGLVDIVRIALHGGPNKPQGGPGQTFPGCTAEPALPR
jgi:CheY-like chemotaxis protein